MRGRHFTLSCHSFTGDKKLLPRTARIFTINFAIPALSVATKCQVAMISYCLVESGRLVVVSVPVVVLGLEVVVVSVPVPVVVCGVSQAAIPRAIIATNKMLFISSVLSDKLI